jgi:hypothetical protein
MDIPRLTHTQYGEEFELIPSFGQYDNGRLAFRLYDDDGPFATVSINLPGTTLYEDDMIFVKSYAENEEIVKTLVTAGWLVPTERQVKSGYIEVPVMRLGGPLRQWFYSLTDAEKVD